MAPTTDVVHQTFWDRVPNATSKIALLGKSQKPQSPLAAVYTSPAPYQQENLLQSYQQRVNKRKRLHPMRSPLSQLSLSAPSPTRKARRLSLDSHTPHRLSTISANANAAIPGLEFPQTEGTNTMTASVPSTNSRSFRLSFSDEYTRNPHQYVQALIDTETVVAANSHSNSGLHKSPSQSSRQRRNGGYRSSNRHGSHHLSSSRRSNISSRSGRFHHLQLEQTISQSMSENDDTQSVTTAASDTSDNKDANTSAAVVVATAVPERLTRRTRSNRGNASTSVVGSSTPDISDSDMGTPRNFATVSMDDSPSNFDAQLDKPSLATADMKDGEDSLSSPGSVNSEPLSSVDESILVAAEDNMPSYLRIGQTFTDESDICQVVPSMNKSTVKWNKADPIDVTNKPMADRLAVAETHCCSVLRILPEQYISIKYILLKEGRNRQPGSFKKRDAQRLCRIDVNKTSRIYEWYVYMGWLPENNGLYNAGPSTTAATV